MIQGDGSYDVSGTADDVANRARDVPTAIGGDDEVHGADGADKNDEANNVKNGFDDVDADDESEDDDNNEENEDHDFRAGDENGCEGSESDKEYSDSSCCSLVGDGDDGGLRSCIRAVREPLTFGSHSEDELHVDKRPFHEPEEFSDDSEKDMVAVAAACLPAHLPSCHGGDCDVDIGPPDSAAPQHIEECMDADDANRGERGSAVEHYDTDDCGWKPIEDEEDSGPGSRRHFLAESLIFDNQSEDELYDDHKQSSHAPAEFLGGSKCQRLHSSSDY
jgi:hypothetical protein